jgi:hypothetical protein
MRELWKNKYSQDFIDTVQPLAMELSGRENLRGKQFTPAHYRGVRQIDG